MSKVQSRSVSGFIALALLATACGSTGLAPVAYPDPTVPCLAGLRSWTLEVLDRRVRRESSDGLQSLVSESVRRSFPGCQWDSPGEESGRVQIEVHRFAANPEGNTWEAAADWTVVASDASGRTLTEFEANEEVSRPNYRGSNNAKEALREAFDRAIRRTLAGLRAVTSAESSRPSGRTVAAMAPAGSFGGGPATLSSGWAFGFC